MSDITRVALDAMGGDHAPAEMVKGAIEAVNKRDDIKILLTGQEALLKKAIFAILPFKSCSFNSWTRLATTIPSKAIKKSFLLVGFV